MEALLHLYMESLELMLVLHLEYIAYKPSFSFGEVVCSLAEGFVVHFHF